MKRALVVAGLCGALSVMGPSQADEITVAGEAFKDVLITKTSSMYYVQLPDQGRTMSIPLAQVDASTVKINKDPYYRGPLKDKYAAAKAKREAGGNQEVDPAFRAAPGEGSKSLSLDDVRGAGGAGGGVGGAGFGRARTELETILKNFGMQFQPGPGNTSAIAQRGGSSIELLGPPESLIGIVVKASGPAAQVDQGVQQIPLLLSQIAPNAAKSFSPTMAKAKADGSASTTDGGFTITIDRTANGDNVDLVIKVTAG